MKTTRCVTCSAEFSDEEIENAECCPSCKTTGLPMAISQDTKVEVNWHCLRVLTIWASNWASQKCDESAQKALENIIKRLESQRKDDWPALTIMGEIKELPETLKKIGIECGRIEAYDSEQGRIYPTKLRVFTED